MRSSIKTSRIKLLIIFAPTGTYVRDHRTTPEVVTISKVSNMALVCAHSVVVVEGTVTQLWSGDQMVGWCGAEVARSAELCAERQKYNNLEL